MKTQVQRFQQVLLMSTVLWGALPAFGADGVDEIVNRGTVRIGVCDFAPWTFLNRDDQLEGYDIDVGRQIANDLGVSPEFKRYDLEGAMLAVQKGEIDFIAAGLAITPERARRVAFTNPYFASGITLIHRQDAGDNGEEWFVAVVENTLSAELAASLHDATRLKTFPDRTSAAAALLSGEVQALQTNVPDAEILLATHADILSGDPAHPIVRSFAGLAVNRSNQDLLNYLNSWILSRQADTWLEGTYNYWFRDHSWIHHLKSNES